MKFYIVVLSLILIVTSSSAEPDGEYCLRQHGAEDAETVKTYFFGLTEGHATDRAGWQWSNEGWNGDRFTPGSLVDPRNGNRREMPELFYRPCSYWKRSWGACQSARSVFSEAVRVAYIAGHLVTLFSDPAPRAYILYGAKTIELPYSSQSVTTYNGDVPKYQWMAMTSPDGQPMFFDGERVVTIRDPEFPMASNKLTSWLVANEPVGNRAFVASKGLKGTTPFLYEILDGPHLEPIKLDKRISGWMTIASISGDQRTWLITRHGVFVEVADGFRRVAHPAHGEHIRGPADLGTRVDGTISLAIETKSGQTSRYDLTNEWEDCRFPISVEKDVVLPSLRGEEPKQ